MGKLLTLPLPNNLDRSKESLDAILARLDNLLDNLDPSIVGTVDEAFAEWERLQQQKLVLHGLNILDKERG